MELTDVIDEAWEALYDDRLDAARAALEKARKLDPDHPEVQLLEIELLLEEDQAEEAVAAAEEALETRPQSMLLKLKLATLLLDVYDDVAGARPLLEDLYKRLEKGEVPDVAAPDEAKKDAAFDFRLEVILTLADTRAADHDPLGGLQIAEQAVKLAPDDAMARVALGAALFDVCRLDDAEKAVGQAIDRDPRCADAYWLRGRILTYRGDEKGADKAFDRAISLDPERFAKPYRVDEDTFAKLMENALEELPEQVRNYLKNVALVVEDVPQLDVLLENDPPLSPGSIGLHDGTPGPEKSHEAMFHYPGRITLFRKNIEISCANEDELKDLVSSTLLHEVGHYLGLDEEDLDERGLG